MLSYQDNVRDLLAQYQRTELPEHKDTVAQKLYDVADYRGYQIIRLEDVIIEALK